MSVLDVATSAKFFKVSSVISTRIDSAATFSNGDLPIHVASNAAPSPPSTRSRVATPSDFEGGDALGLRLAGAVDDPVGDLARLLVEHPALKRGREVLDRAEILDMPVLDAQVRGCARLLALAAFLGALVAGLLGRGLRLGRLGSRCRGDWILRFGMERGAVLVVAGVAAPAERESSGGQQCCADGRDRRLRHQTSPLSASGVPVVVFTWRPDFVFIFETRFVNSCGATMKDAMSAEAAPAIQTLLKMPSATESPQRKIM